MRLSREEVEHIANLARLKLTEEEKERYREQLSSILDHIAQLGELDTAEVPPLNNMLVVDSALRADEPEEGLGLAELLKNAPQAAQDQFRVPPILEGDEGEEDD